MRIKTEEELINLINSESKLLHLYGMVGLDEFSGIHVLGLTYESIEFVATLKFFNHKKKSFNIKVKNDRDILKQEIRAECLKIEAEIFNAMDRDWFFIVSIIEKFGCVGQKLVISNRLDLISFIEDGLFDIGDQANNDISFLASTRTGLISLNYGQVRAVQIFIMYLIKVSNHISIIKKGLSDDLIVLDIDELFDISEKVLSDINNYSSVENLRSSLSVVIVLRQKLRDEIKDVFDYKPFIVI